MAAIFHLTGGEEHDLVGAAPLLPEMRADRLIADKAFDADKRVIEPLRAAGKTAVIPPKANRAPPRDFDRQIYKARHLMENFFARIKQSALSRPDLTRPPATSPPRFTSSPTSLGLIDDRP